jgi:dTDP-4-dehydrorhamnose reductase
VVEATSRKMRILVTGSDGQLGMSLRKTLPLAEFDALFLNRATLDITDKESTISRIREISPDWIINCAAWTNVDQAELNQDQCRRVNLGGVENLYWAASAVGAKIIQISTDYVFSGQSEEPWNESAQTSGISCYGKSKSDAESFLLQEYRNESIILRTSWLFSAYRNNFAKTMVRIGRSESSKLRVVCDQIGQPTSCADLSELIKEMIIANLRGTVLHGTNTGQASWFEFAQEIFSQIGLDPDRIEPVSSKDYPQIATRPAYSVLGNEGLRKANLNVMRPWKDALAAEIFDIDAEVKREGANHERV